MSAKHTPGPWIAGNDEDSDFFLVGPEYFPGIVTDPVVKLHSEANANLIAAAPEMLEALKNIYDLLEDGHWQETKRHIFELIEKAEGQS